MNIDEATIAVLTSTCDYCNKDIKYKKDFFFLAQELYVIDSKNTEVEGLDLNGHYHLECFPKAMIEATRKLNLKVFW